MHRSTGMSARQPWGRHWMGCGLVLAALLATPALAGQEIDAAASAYKQAAAADVAAVIAGAEKLEQLLEKGDLAAARQAWIEARVGWERSETFTASMFPEFDKEIDPWPDARSASTPSRRGCSAPAATCRSTRPRRWWPS